MQEERLAVGSISKQFGVPLPGKDPLDSRSGYARYNKNPRETNLDIMVTSKRI